MEVCQRGERKGTVVREDGVERGKGGERGRGVNKPPNLNYLNFGHEYMSNFLVTFNSSTTVTL